MRIEGLPLIACVAAVACAPSDGRYFGRAEPRRGDGELVTNLGSEPEWIDPGKCADGPGGEVIFNLFAGLVESHPETLEPIPELAERWEVSEDGRRWLFHLRESTWSDGAPLTAHDFVYSFVRVLDPATGAKYATALYPLVNARAFAERAVVLRGARDLEAVKKAAEALGPIEGVSAVDWPDPAVLVFVGGEQDARPKLRERLLASLDGAALATPELVGVRALDDRTLELRLANPLPYFLQMLSYYTSRPVPRHVIERLRADGMNPDLWTRPEHLVVSGAYRVAEHAFRRHYLLEKNPRYWDAARVRTPRVRMLMVDSYNTALNLYRAGELDLIGAQSQIPFEFVDSVRGYGDFKSSPYLGIYHYWVNTKRPPLNDVRVRQALALAIDRPALVRYVTRGGQLPSASLVPPGLPNYRGADAPVFDATRARALLADAGYPEGRNFPTVTLTYNTSEGHKQLAEAIQQMWKKELGVTVNIENQEWKVFLDNLEQKNYDIARLGWIGDYPDPYSFLELLLGYSGNNHSSWTSPRYDALLEQANATLDAEARFGLLREAEAMLVAEVPLIPIYVYTRLDLVKPYVRGWSPNILNKHLFKWMWIEGD